MTAGSNSALAKHKNTRTNITEDGVGTATQTSAPGCQNGGTCTTEVRGNITGTPIDNPDPTEGIVGTLSADYSQATTSPDQSTFSVPASGDVTLTDTNGSQLLLSVEGTLSGPTAPGAQLTFTGTFTVTDSTGQLSRVRGGNGNITATLTGAIFTASLDGTLLKAKKHDKKNDKKHDKKKHDKKKHNKKKGGKGGGGGISQSSGQS
jgi:hypothetical protein